MNFRFEWETLEIKRNFTELRGILTTVQLLISCLAPVGIAFGILEPETNITLSVIYCASIGGSWLIRKNSVKLQKFAVILLCEYINITYYYLSYTKFPNHSHELLLTSTTFMLIFEIKLIQNQKISLLVLLKHLAVWFGENFLTTIRTLSPELPALYAPLVFLYLVYCNDKTAKKESLDLFKKQTQLQETQKRLSVLIENMPGGLLLLSSSFEVLLRNNNSVNLLPEQTLEAFGQLQYSQERRFFYRDSPDRGLLEDVKKCFDLGLNQEITLGITYFEEEYLEWKAKKVEWGNEQAVLLIIKNVNEIIRYEQVSSENRCKNAILRSVSHELRTPTNSICCLTDKLLELQNLEKDSVENLKIIKISSDLLLSLINDLLDYSRMLAGAFRIEKSDCEARETFEQVIRLVEVQASKKNIRIFSRIDSFVPEVIFTDDKRLRQVLINLLNNAVKFTFKGEIELCAWINHKNKLGVCVRDTGIGIPQERQSELFRLFSRVHDAEVTAEGCGLGLHISNLLVKELGGDCIQVNSVQGLGSSFSFEIDIFREPPSIICSSDSEDSICEETDRLVSVYKFSVSAKTLKSVEVMVVDDESFNRHIVVTVLKSLNIGITEACNGKEAVEKVKRLDRIGSALKVIIMDCSMPEMNGWQATQEIKRIHSEQVISAMPTIIGYTAFTGANETSECFRSGMTKVLSKPVDSQILLKTVASYIF